MSEVVETSKPSDGRSERNTRPPPAMGIRRDDRAEPDDDDAGSSRIDVVNVDGGVRDNAASGMVSLRRELAKLHQQAALVERSLEDQRRDRSDSLERLERTTERAQQLEARVTSLEAELLAVRSERDDLERAVEGAKVATADLGKLREEVERIRERAAESSRTGPELARAREDAANAEQEALLAREEAAKANEEARRATAEAARAKSDLEQARDAMKIAEGDAAMVGEQASKIRDEASKIRAEAEQTQNELRAARADAAKTHGELAHASSQLATVTTELTKARAELSRAKEDNARDRLTARDRIDLLERSLDDARSTSLRTEAELEKSRASEERLGRQLEAALASAALAESRAAATSSAHATLENNLRRLREEIAGAFARVGHAAQPPPLPHRSEHPNPVVSLPPEMFESLPPSAPPQEAPPREASQAPQAPSAQPAAAPPSMPPDNAWETPSSMAPSAIDAAPGSGDAPSPVSKSVPPPPTASSAPGPLGAGHASIPPPTYASVPPQIHDSAAPYGGPVPSLVLRKPTLAPPAHEPAPPQGARKTTAPPPPPGTLPPGSRLGSLPPVHGLTAAEDWRDSPPPATRRPGNSAMPPPPDDIGGDIRAMLLAKLVDPDSAGEAVIELRQHPEWLRSVPPPTFVAALASVDYDSDAPVFDLARLWDREPLCHSLIASLRSESEPRLREHSAWLLKHLAAPSSWKAIADLARSDDEPVQLRRWLLEALHRLAAGRGIGWRELGDLVTSVSRHPDPSLRDGVVGILVSLDRSDDKRRVLMDILRTDDDEVVLASAVNALASVLPMDDLDPAVADRLLGHPSPRVQRSVKELIERMSRTRS